MYHHNNNTMVVHVPERGTCTSNRPLILTLAKGQCIQAPRPKPPREDGTLDPPRVKVTTGFVEGRRFQKPCGFDGCQHDVLTIP